MVVPDNKSIENMDRKIFEVGKVYAAFDSVASAFVCYNLLNGKEYDEHKVEI